MRIYLVALFLLWASSIPSWAQENSNPNLYSEALFASIMQMDKSWGNMKDGDQLRTDYHHVIVEKDPVLTDELPGSRDDYFVEYLDTQGLIARYKGNNKQFLVFKIFPIQTKESNLRIHILVSWFSYQKKRALFAITDWGDVTFQFDCQTQQFVITGVKLGGI